MSRVGKGPVKRHREHVQVDNGIDTNARLRIHITRTTCNKQSCDLDDRGEPRTGLSPRPDRFALPSTTSKMSSIARPGAKCGSLTGSYQDGTFRYSFRYSMRISPAFPCLTYLTIEACPNVEEGKGSSLVRNLQGQLRYLDITEFPRLLRMETAALLEKVVGTIKRDIKQEKSDYNWRVRSKHG